MEMSKEKTEYLLAQIRRMGFGEKKMKIYEIALLTPVLLDSDLNDLMPCTQHRVDYDNGHHLIDLYYPSLNAAIEIDEPYHEAQKEVDMGREAKIKGIENCTFKRIQISEDFNIYEVSKVLKKYIIEKRAENKKNGTFKEWVIIKHTMEQVQNDYLNAIFFKVPKEPSGNSIEPTRVPIQISAEKRREANLFVAYSGNVVTNVYTITPDIWEPYPDNNLGFYQQGQEIPNHPLLSSGMTTQWTTSNRMFGNNLTELKPKNILKFVYSQCN
jgi:very-short-patch-repair endonuclease